MLHRIVALSIFLKYCLKKRMPMVKTYKELKKLAKERQDGIIHLINIDYLNNEKASTFMPYGEYVETSVRVNGVKAGDLLDNKTILYKRCPQVLGRECLYLEECTEEEKIAFIKRHPRFVGKRNYGRFAERFSCYDTSKQSIEEILKSIQDNRQVLLEEYIVQHEEISKIYPNCVNTIRVHTVTDGEQIRIFQKPKMRLGANGSIVDANGKKGGYRLILNLDGTVERAVWMSRFYYISPAYKHKNTGVVFQEVRIPYLEEVISLVKEAASYFPELRYIGWDVAITPSGPVIVEGNYVSGAMNTYQVINYLAKGEGLKKDIEEMEIFCKRGERTEEE